MSKPQWPESLAAMPDIDALSMSRHRHSAQELAAINAYQGLGEQTQRIHQAFHARSWAQALDQARCLFSALRDDPLNWPLGAQTTCIELVMGVLRMLQNRTPTPYLDGWLERLRQCAHCDTLEAMEQATLAILADLADCLEKRDFLGAQLAAQVSQMVGIHYAEPLTVDGLAQACRVSASRLQTAFKRETGRTIRQHIIHLRMDHAKRLLCTTQDPIYAVSAQVGYQDAGFFVRSFTKSTGMSPLQYREMYTYNN